MSGFEFGAKSLHYCYFELLKPGKFICIIRRFAENTTLILCPLKASVTGEELIYCNRIRILK